MNYAPPLPLHMYIYCKAPIYMCVYIYTYICIYVCVHTYIGMYLYAYVLDSRWIVDRKIDPVLHASCDGEGPFLASSNEDHCIM